MVEANKFITISTNLIRYSEHQASQGCYLNAVLVVNQIAKDVLRKLRQNIISGEQANDLLTKLGAKKNEYINQAKKACPKRFMYDLENKQQKSITIPAASEVEPSASLGGK